MLKIRLFSVVMGCVFVLGAQAQDADSPIDSSSEDPILPGGVVIEGDKLEIHLDRKMRAIGNASIHRDAQDIYGDVIEYDVQNDMLHVTGNAQIDLGKTHIVGPELRMQLSDTVGEMRDASMTMMRASQPKVGLESVADEAPGVAQPIESRGDAKMVFFEGQDKKRLQGARYTTCAAGVDDWYIKSSEMELNDYTESGVAKNAYIEFKGVPLLYNPYISFSYNNQRKSGFLAPTYGTTSTGGFDLTVPFYWNISPNMDATLTTRALSKRGAHLQGEFRYLEEKFSGTDVLEYLPNDNEFGKSRWFADLKHQHNLGAGWSAGYGLEKVSDNQYFSDLSTRINSTSRVILPQQVNVDYADDTWRFNTLVQKFQTLDNASYPYERLPQMTLTGSQSIAGMDTNLYTQFVAFDTNKRAPTMVTGTRVTLYPSISLPLNQPYGYVTPKIGIHHTYYNLSHVASDLETQQRTLPIFSVDSGLYFDREFKVADRDYSHTLEPRLFYVYVPNRNQATLPVFDTGESDLNLSTLFSDNQFSGNDRINNANQISASLTTRLIESATGVQRLSATVGQRFYFVDQKVGLTSDVSSLRTNRKSDVLAGVTANLRTHWNLDAVWQYNTDNARPVRSTITSSYTPEAGKVLNLSYSYRRDSLEQVNVSGQWPLGQGWYGVARSNYDVRENKSVENLAGLEYNAGCWQARAVVQRLPTATGKPNNILFFQLELGGLASVGTNPLSVIQRNVPGYVSPGFLPDPHQ